MKSLAHFCCFILVIIASTIPASFARSMAYQDDDSNVLYNNYPDLEIEKLFHPAQQKRDCVRRGGSCAYRPNGCCQNNACRCNLWGANCRCQRMGLFQKWG
nr:PREDICTED: U8-agatoxin-Ao1a-like [Bemisia tabaci]